MPGSRNLAEIDSMPYLNEARWLLRCTNSLKELFQLHGDQTLLLNGCAATRSLRLPLMWLATVVWACLQLSAECWRVAAFPYFYLKRPVDPATKEEADISLYHRRDSDSWAIATSPPVLIPGGGPAPPRHDSSCCLVVYRGLLCAQQPRRMGEAVGQNSWPAVPMVPLQANLHWLASRRWLPRPLQCRRKWYILLEILSSAYAISSHPSPANRRPSNEAAIGVRHLTITPVL